jgi:predicted ATP-grasp superfamily ATP-dependent carboligase
MPGGDSVTPARRVVTVFDIDLPPGVAFVRSLGRAGVPLQVLSADRRAAGRWSRYAGKVRQCPPVRHTDEFVAFLVDGITDESIDLVAPTSDYVVFAVGAAADKLGIDAVTVGHPRPAAVRTALFKDRFHEAVAGLGFPTPPWATPATVEEAAAAGDEIGYPVVLKPRTHAGIGLRRGVVVTDAAAMARTFRPWPLRAGHDTVRQYDADVALPLVQRYYELGTADVVSVSGVLAGDGSVSALAHSRKVAASPRRLGVGTMFEALGPQAFTVAALRAVREILGRGMFELEVLVDRATGAHQALDLNPRGFGQMSLDIGRGNDLPVLWYQNITGTSLEAHRRRRRTPEVWHDALGTYVGYGVRLARGPDRMSIARQLWSRMRSPTVGAMHDWTDPLPGVQFALDHLRHPRAFVRPYLMDSEMRDRDRRPQVMEDPGHVRDSS